LLYVSYNNDEEKLMARLGIISGTIFLQTEGIADHPEERRIETAFGSAQVFLTERVVSICRHGTDAASYILPHRINHPANFSALKSLGVEEVIAINSTGSLKQTLRPGMLVVPDDFILLSPGPTVFHDKPVHTTPTLDEALRRQLLESARACGIEVVDGGVYWQTAGPRFETRAEIRFMAQTADLVGMTMAGEAVIAKELSMAYASLCSVDNYAHGLVGQALTMDEILRHAHLNAGAVSKIVKQYLKRRGS
jgi:purine nucleoside phosphorylase